MPEAPMPAVGLKDVTKRFPGVVANDAITLEFCPGEVHALLGENGAGKSTLIGLLAGMLQPDEGSIEIFGKRRALLVRASRWISASDGFSTRPAGAEPDGDREFDAGQPVVAATRP